MLSGIYTLLASGIRAATQTFLNTDAKFGSIQNPQLSGIIAYLNITVAPGGDTVQLSFEEQDPISGTWTAIAATTATAATNQVILKVMPGVTPVAASQTGIVVAQAMPALWRIRVIHSAGTNFTYSLAVTLFASAY